MQYRVLHKTTYRYEEMVSICHNEAHLEPRDTPWQRCLDTDIEVEPEPALLVAERDYFGNRTRFFTVQEPHHQMVVSAFSHVEIVPAELPAPDETPPWDALREHVQADRSDAALQAYEMTFDSPRVHFSDMFLSYAKPSFPAGRPILEAALDLTHRIHQDFEYRPGATSVITPVAQVFRTRVGVCQDFAHIQIACLRALGLGARYVSGYLRTHPPEGQPRLVGADASHAWVAVWCGEPGWIDLDPTNDVCVSDQHVTLAWGRDYGDVAPIRGVLLGGREHTVQVSVDVETGSNGQSDLTLESDERQPSTALSEAATPAGATVGPLGG